MSSPQMIREVGAAIMRYFNIIHTNTGITLDPYVHNGNMH